MISLLRAATIVEPFPLLHDALCPEAGLHVHKPPGRVVRPKGGREMVLWLFAAAIVERRSVVELAKKMMHVF
jgi:hypothetical protein